MAVKIETKKELQIALSTDEYQSSFKLNEPITGLESDTTLTSAVTDILLGDPEGSAADNMFAVKGVYAPKYVKMSTVETTTTTFVDTKEQS